MAEYALVDGELAPVSKLGERAVCWDPTCSWEMIARPGNGQVLPHWAHKPGSGHVYSSDTEKGEWHREVQHLFRIRGAELEVPMRSTDGKRDHKADIVLADTRIIEAQTKYLSADDIASREATYGEMCWIYDARDFAKWFILGNDGGATRFNWGKPDRAFMLHSKPIYFDTGDGVWVLEQMHARHRKGNKGRVIYEGRRRKVADNLLEFVDKVTATSRFHDRARMTLIDPRKNNRGVRFRTLTEIDEWMAQHEKCSYETFVLDEAVEQAERDAEAKWLADAMARYEAQQSRMKRLVEQENERVRLVNQQAAAWRERMSNVPPDRHLSAVSNPQPQPQRQTDQSSTDWDRLAGLTCTCRVGCTDVRWGDAGICAPDCRPCRIMADVTYTSPRASRKTAE